MSTDPIPSVPSGDDHPAVVLARALFERYRQRGTEIVELTRVGLMTGAEAEFRIDENSRCAAALTETLRDATAKLTADPGR